MGITSHRDSTKQLPSISISNAFVDSIRNLSDEFTNMVDNNLFDPAIKIDDFNAQPLLSIHKITSQLVAS